MATITEAPVLGGKEPEFKPIPGVTEEEIKESLFPDEVAHSPERFLPIIRAKVERGKLLKDKGGELFTQQNYTEAIEYFARAQIVACVEQLNLITDETLKDQVSDIFSKSSNNIAACYMKLEKWQDALIVIKQVLSYDLSNAKAYYRAGKCLQSLGKTREAYEILNNGARILRESFGQELTREFIELKNEVARDFNRQEEELRRLYQGALSPGKKPPVPADDEVVEEGSAALGDAVLGIETTVASLVALDKYRAGLQIDTPEILATGALLGLGVFGFSRATQQATKIASISSVLMGIGYVGFKLWKSFSK